MATRSKIITVHPWRLTIQETQEKQRSKKAPAKHLLSITLRHIDGATQGGIWTYILPAPRSVIREFQAQIWQKIYPREAVQLSQKAMAHIDNLHKEAIRKGKPAIFTEPD